MPPDLAPISRETAAWLRTMCGWRIDVTPPPPRPIRVPKPHPDLRSQRKAVVTTSDDAFWNDKAAVASLNRDIP